jgi:hypothetical protein
MKTDISKKTPDQIKAILAELALSWNQPRLAKYHFDYHFDEEFFCGACPICGNSSGVKHIGADDWFYCEDHKTAWCVSAGIAAKNYDESDQDVVRFFQDGGYSKVKPISSIHELPENKAAMLDDLKAVPVTCVDELQLINNQVVRDQVFGPHPLPESCDVQIRFSKNWLSVEEKLALLKQVIQHLETQDANEWIFWGGVAVMVDAVINPNPQ